MVASRANENTPFTAHKKRAKKGQTGEKVTKKYGLPQTVLIPLNPRKIEIIEQFETSTYYVLNM